MKTTIQILLVTLLIQACDYNSEKVEGLTESQDKKINVKTHVVASKQIAIKNSFYAEIKFNKHATLNSNYAGVVQNLNLEVGSYVKQGQILLKYPNQANKLEIEQAQISVNELSENYQRQLKLHKKGAVSEVAILRLKNQLKLQQKNLERTQEMFLIRAPFNGVVTHVNTKEGVQIQPGTPLISIASPNNLEAWFYVGKKHISIIEMNQPVSIRLHNDTILGSITSKALAMDTKRKAYLIKARFSSKSLEVLAGQTVPIWIKFTSEIPKTIIPWESIIREGNRQHVFKILKGKAHKQSVTLSTITEQWLTVEQGLEPGNVIATAGKEKLKEGTAVNIIKD